MMAMMVSIWFTDDFIDKLYVVGLPIPSLKIPGDLRVETRV